MAKRDDVENCVAGWREIKGEVMAVGDGMAAGPLKRVVRGFAEAGQVGNAELGRASEPARHGGDFQAYLHVALMVLIGSTTAPAAKYVVHDLPLALIPVLRFAVAAVCLLPVVWPRGGLGPLIRQDGWRLLLAAAFCVPINQGFFLGATRLGLTSHVGLFYATCPLVVLLLAWALRMERPDMARLSGVLLSVAGIVVIGFGHYWERGAHQGGASPIRRTFRPPAARRRHVVGGLHHREQAPHCAAWRTQRPRRYIPCRNVAIDVRAAARDTIPGFAQFIQPYPRIGVSLDGTGSPRYLHHSVRLGLSESVVTPI